MKKTTIFVRFAIVAALSLGVAEKASAVPFWGATAVGGDMQCIDGEMSYLVQDYRFWIAWGDGHYVGTGEPCSN